MGKVIHQSGVRVFLPACLFFSAILFGAASVPQDTVWLNLESGLDWREFSSPQKSMAGDSLIRILRVNPKAFELRLLNASAPDQGKRMSVKNWVRRNGLVAGINSSLYQKDFLTSVSLMQTRSHVNSTWLSKDRTILAFDPYDPSLPSVKIIDRDCDDFQTLKKKFGTLIQSIRMVSCRGKNVWAQQNKKQSIAAIGQDAQGRILFIHARSPYTTHDLINILLKLPIGLKRAMYVEGGTEAQLYIHTGKHEFEFVGVANEAAHPISQNQISWPVPNVVGIVRASKRG